MDVPAAFSMAALVVARVVGRWASEVDTLSLVVRAAVTCSFRARAVTARTGCHVKSKKRSEGLKAAKRSFGLDEAFSCCTTPISRMVSGKRLSSIAMRCLNSFANFKSCLVLPD